MIKIFSRNDLFFILVGMVTHTTMVAVLGVTHIITLSAGQQLVTAILFLILILTKFFKRMNLDNNIIIGMLIQALMNGLLALLGIILLNPGQQAIASVIYLVLIVVILLLRKKKIK